MEKGREWAVGSVPKHGTELWNRFGFFWTAVTMCVDCLGALYHNFSINYVLVSRRPEMGKKFGSKK